MTTFNTLSDISKKQRMLFLAETIDGVWNPIAYSTSANLSFSADDVDVSNKMDGDWSTSMQGKKSAEVSVDALVAYKDGLTNEVLLQEGWNADKVYFFLYIVVDVVTSEDGLTTTLKYVTSLPFYMGRMKISSLELTSDNGDVAKFSCSGNSEGTVTEHKEIIAVAEKDPDNAMVTFKIYDPAGANVGEDLPDGKVTGAEATVSDFLESEIDVEVYGNIVEITTTLEFHTGDIFTVHLDDYEDVITYVY